MLKRDINYEFNLSENQLELSLYEKKQQRYFTYGKLEFHL